VQRTVIVRELEIPAVEFVMSMVVKSVNANSFENLFLSEFKAIISHYLSGYVFVFSITNITRLNSGSGQGRRDTSGSDVLAGCNVTFGVRSSLSSLSYAWILAVDMNRTLSQQNFTERLAAMNMDGSNDASTQSGKGSSSVTIAVVVVIMLLVIIVVVAIVIVRRRLRSRRSIKHQSVRFPKDALPHSESVEMYQNPMFAIPEDAHADSNLTMNMAYALPILTVATSNGNVPQKNDASRDPQYVNQSVLDNPLHHDYENGVFLHNVRSSSSITTNLKNISSSDLRASTSGLESDPTTCYYDIPMKRVAKIRIAESSNDADKSQSPSIYTALNTSLRDRSGLASTTSTSETSVAPLDMNHLHINSSSAHHVTGSTIQKGEVVVDADTTSHMYARLSKSQSVIEPATTPSDLTYMPMSSTPMMQTTPSQAHPYINVKQADIDHNTPQYSSTSRIILLDESSTSLQRNSAMNSSLYSSAHHYQNAASLALSESPLSLSDSSS
jgi:hypothetical protein